MIHDGVRATQSPENNIIAEAAGSPVRRRGLPLHISLLREWQAERRQIEEALRLSNDALLAIAGHVANAPAADR